MNQESPSRNLQFDKADFDRDRFRRDNHCCQDCEQPLGASYYTVDGRVTCFGCSDKASAEPAQDLGGLPKGIIYGAGAAALGALVYLLILKFTGYEIGLIAIAVGWLVGKGMMKGSKNRGGRAYQVLAVLLTYHSIVFSYIAVGIWQFIESPDAAQTAVEGPATNPPDAATSAETTGAGNAGVSGAEVAQQEVEEEMPSLPVFLVGLYFTALTIPFYDGFGNILGIAIIAFGLWEAWRKTGLQIPAIAGPFNFGEGAQMPASSDPEATSF